jgi:hypothetical protein
MAPTAKIVVATADALKYLRTKIDRIVVLIMARPLLRSRARLLDERRELRRRRGPIRGSGVSPRPGSA